MCAAGTGGVGDGDGSRAFVKEPPLTSFLRRRGIQPPASNMAHGWALVKSINHVDVDGVG